jgi:membrane-bound lytic murein transglycosylase F
MKRTCDGSGSAAQSALSFFRRPPFFAACGLLLFCLLTPAPDFLSLSNADTPLPVLRIAAAVRVPEESRISHFGPGFERGLVYAFCAEYGYSPRWIVVDSRRAALRMLREGGADLMIGFSGRGDGMEDLQSGPVYSGDRPLELVLPLRKSAEESALPERLGSRSLNLWRPFLPAGSLTLPPSRGEDRYRPHRWYWRDDALLGTELRDFWTRRGNGEDTLLARLDELHFGFLPKRFNPHEIKELMDALAQRLPRYQSEIGEAARIEDLDPLLFTAVIFQESRLDPATVSPTGVRGIMQLTARTAAFLKVDRLDPVQALRGGARYLRYLWNGLESLDLEYWDRWFFALAAFNQGARRLEGAMELSRKLGGSGRTWRELKKVYPLLAKTAYAGMVGQGPCRGGEAVRFVENVRWYYHVLRSLVTLSRPEAQHLAPLLADSGSSV